MHGSLIACTSHAQLTPHPLQLTLQVVSKRVQWEKTGILKGFHCPRTPLSEVVHKSESELICIFPLKQAVEQLRRAFLSKHHLLWFALRPSPGLEQLWKHLYAAHLNMCFRQIFRGSFKGERLMLSLPGIHYPSCECWRQKLTLSRRVYLQSGCHTYFLCKQSGN